MKLSGAQILCESLLWEGVEVLFGYPGGAILPFYDALLECDRLRHVLVRHEQAAAHAAEGYARAGSKVGVCVVTSGPGATNLVTGLAAAKMDSVPLVAITGQAPRFAIGKEGFQEVDTIGITRPVTKENFLVLHAADLAATVRRAFAVATSGRPGPVLIDVPKDVQAELAEYHRPEAVAKTPERKDYAGEMALLLEAARLLNQAQRPVIIAGHGVVLSEACEELRALAETANVPVVNTLHGVGALPWDHPLSLGMLGMHGMYWCNQAVDRADLVLGVGMRFDDRITGRPGSFAPRARVVHIEVEPSQVGKNVPTHVPLVGDAGAVLRALLPLVVRRGKRDWLDEIQRLRRDHPCTTDPDTWSLSPQYVLTKLSQTLGRSEDQVVVTGVGQHQMWAAQLMQMSRPHSFISSGGLGVMGYELPAAMGAQVARPNATVWSIAGDGGFQMTPHELATLVNEGLPVKIALINNGSLGMVHQWQDLFYGRRYESSVAPGPDYVKLAQAYGFPAVRVTDKDDVEAALEEALRHRGPFLIDFVVDPAENVYPMVPPGASLGEMVEDPRRHQASMAANGVGPVLSRMVR